MSVLPVGIGSEEAGYRIERSLRFDSSASAYLSRTPASAGNRKTWTWSGWVKRSVLDSNMQALFGCIDSGAAYYTNLVFDNTTPNTLVLYDNLVGGSTVVLRTTQLFRDVSAWYHIVLAYDTTQATAANRVKMYVNGSEITAFSTDARSSLTQNADGSVNRANQHGIGTRQPFQGNYFNGYLAEVHFIDGSALDPTSFGEYNTDTGVWQPKAYTGSYGTNGFYLDFADNSSTTALGYDAAGSNDWTPNNFSVTAGAGNDSLVDTPTPYGTDTGAGGVVRGNYATLNPLDNQGLTIANGNLDASYASAAFKTSRATVSMTSGKWYFEALANQTWNYGEFGVMPTSAALPSSGYIGASGVNGYAYQTNGYLYNNDVSTNSGISTVSSGDIMMCAVDIDAGKIWFGKNGSWFNSGAPASGTNAAYTTLSGSYSPAVSIYSGSSGLTVNFGQRAFSYSAPSGFKALCTQNLPEPTVVDGGEYFQAVPYQGNSSTQTISGVGFQPDFTWLKGRSYAGPHKLFDAVRGATKSLSSNLTDAEVTDSDALTAFTSDGFSLGADGDVNRSADGGSHISWNWKANGSGVSNTDGTITSTVSANTTSGFSIVTYTGNGTSGATVGHGLGMAPSMMIVKNRTSGYSYGWNIYHASLGATKLISFDTGAASTLSSAWNDTAPTSSVFSLGNLVSSNRSGNDFVSYAFAPVAGYSAFGSYTGNGSSDGPFIFCNFRPRYLMIKNYTTAGNGWIIIDTARSTYNTNTLQIYANSSAAEGSGSTAYVDILSNGFKLRSGNSDINDSSVGYIYAAFAENPFKFSLAR